MKTASEGKNRTCQIMVSAIFSKKRRNHVTMGRNRMDRLCGGDKKAKMSEPQPLSRRVFNENTFSNISIAGDTFIYFISLFLEHLQAIFRAV